LWRAQRRSRRQRTQSGGRYYNREGKAARRRYDGGLIKCERSPRPVNVGVNTLCPFRSSRSDTLLQHHPPCQAPCTSTNVLLAFWASATVTLAITVAPRLAPAASTIRRVVMHFSYWLAFPR